jgi:hypothetical protein
MNLGQYLVQQLLEDNIQEVYPKRSSDDINQELVTREESEIERTAEEFNIPIPDIRLAFVAGNMVVLTDSIWSKLENTDSWNIQSLEDAIKLAEKYKKDWKSTLAAIKAGKSMDPPMVLNYDQDKYYLVGGNTRLMFYKALGITPKVLMAVLNLKGPKPFPLKEGLDKDTLNSFLKFAIKELGLKQLPSKITLSKNTKKARERHTFGTFNPENKSIWLYTNNRNTADILRTLAHELVHRKQEENDRLKPDSGETGSEIENEANAKAGVLLRKFGEKNPMIYEQLMIKEIGDISNPFEWQYDFVDGEGNHFYSFNSPQNKYSVGITYNGDDSYEVFFNTEEETDLDTGEGVATRVLSTITQITIDFINRVKPEEVIFRPIQTKSKNDKIDTRRFNVYGVYIRKNLPPDYGLLTLGDSYRIIKK